MEFSTELIKKMGKIVAEEMGKDHARSGKHASSGKRDERASSPGRS